MATKFITYTVTTSGYEILIHQGMSTIDEYSAGNCNQDSVTIVPFNDPSRIPLRTLKQLALRTARELADEHGISYQSIEIS